MTAEELRELDARIHREAMGRDCIRAAPEDGGDWYCVVQSRGNSVQLSDKIPRYSTDIAAAWEVHKAMCDLIFSKRVRYLEALAEAAAFPSGHRPSGLHVLVAARDRFPEVICLAALATVTLGRSPTA